MKIGNRRYKIHWWRLLLLLAVVVTFITLIVLTVKGIAWLFADKEEATAVAAKSHKTLVMSDKDKAIAARIDKFMNTPQRLDTTTISILVVNAESGATVYQRRAGKPLVPSSCMKIATALSALEVLGHDHKYNESIQIRGELRGDTLWGNLLLRADADPLLESFDTLTRQVRNYGIKHVEGNIYLDLEMADTLRAHPTAKTWDIPYHKVPLLLRGKRYVERTLIYSLRSAGISYRQNMKVTPKVKYRIIAVQHHLMRDAITPMLIHSSNIKAEAVLYHLDAKTGVIRDHQRHWDVQHASERWLRSALAKDSAALKGIVINDGSGLSPDNRLSATSLVSMLSYAYDDMKLRNYFINEALASPGHPQRRGSMLSRQSRAEYLNRVFVKTGTLTTVGASSLAGYVHAADGTCYIFAIINTDSPVAESRIFQDRLCREIMANPSTIY